MVDLPTETDPAMPMTNGVRCGRLVAGQEERPVGLVEPLGLLDVQGEQPGERQVHLAHLVEVHGVAEAAQPVELGGGERQRGALPQLRPRPPVEIDVRRVGHALKRRRRGPPSTPRELPISPGAARCAA